MKKTATDTATKKPSPIGPLVRVRGLKKHFPIRRGLFSQVAGVIKAVDGVSFDLAQGKTLGLVGESGSGKSTLGRVMLRLIPATSGGVLFDGLDLFSLPNQELRALRRRMQIVFQDPVSSLNPRMTIGATVGEPLRIHRAASRSAIRERVAELLERVGLPASAMNRYPHEFSGGQRQRVGIARAIALNPSFIVCDEPVSSLDVSVQSQILNLLADLRDEMNISYLFIAHDLAVVRHFCDDVAVMYLGKIVELAPAERLYEKPAHPYTQALLQSAPSPDPQERHRHATVSGEVADPIHPPRGCAFHPRCPFATEECRRVEPKLESKKGLADARLVACHYAENDLNFADAIQSSG